jgi:uncharacterized protein (DUF934 family)
MPLLDRDGREIADPWHDVGDEAAMPGTDQPVPDQPVPDQPVIVSLARWQRDRLALERRNGPLGVRLSSDQDPALIAGDLGRFGVVVLVFPRFRDGRGFSQARLLRERHGYTGEIRAVGPVLPDQFPFLIRCGFTTVALAEDADPGAWRTALGEISIAYQPALGDGAPLSGLRRRIGA